MSKVLVTGASGFVGSHVAETLAGRGLSVRALVRRSSKLAFLGQAGAELAFGDVNDPASLSPALAGAQGVVHCAGLTKALSFSQYREVNRDGTENVLRACCSMQHRPSRIVVLSSLAAFGPSCHGRPLCESDEPHPISDYGRSKLEGHRVAESFMKDLSVSILIPPAVYGPRDRDVYAYFKFAKLGFVPFLGSPERCLSLVYVKDLAQTAVECLLREEAAGKSYFVEDGDVHTWRSFADAINLAMARKPVPVVVPRSFARTAAALVDVFSQITRRPPLLGTQKMCELLQPSWTCSGERIRKELGLQIQYPLRQGIEETYRWYVEHHWL